MNTTPWDKVQPLYGIDEWLGCSDTEIGLVRKMFGALPETVETFWSHAARTEALHRVQDCWMLPEEFREREWLQKSDHLILLNENQGVCRAGIRKEDLHLPDPPVYSTEDDETWKPCARTVSEFLSAALAYEAVYQCAYSPEEFFLQLTKNEAELLRERLEKLPFEMKNWINETTIRLFRNADDNIAVTMDCGDGEPTLLYGAATEASYDKLRKVLDGIGEPM